MQGIHGRICSIGGSAGGTRLYNVSGAVNMNAYYLDKNLFGRYAAEKSAFWKTRKDLHGRYAAKNVRFRPEF